MLKRTHYTETPSQSKVVREVVFIDAKDEKLGRVSTKIATHLIGKHKTNFVSNIDVGDYVVVTNAQKLDIAQKKLLTKEYNRYSGYQSGRKTTLLAHMWQADPTAPIKLAVKGMLPDNKLKTNRMKRLFIFKTAEYTLPQDIQKLIKNK